MSAKAIAFINLKGGVAKTTTTVGLATVLAGAFHRRVLVIDLDPQTNCTTMLIGEDRWKELNRQGYTLCTLFRDAMYGTSNFNMEKTLQKDVSAIGEVHGLDLIPSSLDIIEIQDKIVAAHLGKFSAVSPSEIIKGAIKGIRKNYDYILIDCPPNMGIITLNGLRIANGYIIPTIPDVLSTYGLPQITTKVRDFSDEIGEDIDCLGIVATKVRKQSSLHTNTLRELERGRDAPLFQTRFYESNELGAAAEYQSYGTLRQKWGYQGQYDSLVQFAEEVMERMEKRS